MAACYFMSLCQFTTLRNNNKNNSSNIGMLKTLRYSSTQDGIKSDHFVKLSRGHIMTPYPTYQLHHCIWAYETSGQPRDPWNSGGIAFFTPFPFTPSPPPAYKCHWCYVQVMLHAYYTPLYWMNIWNIWYVHSESKNYHNIRS